MTKFEHILQRTFLERRRVAVGTAIAVVSFALSAATDAFAQTTPARQVAQDDADAQALRGPSVAEQPKANTLIERAFDGKLKRPETDPVLAALARLELDGPTREAVDTVIAQRNAIVDKLVLENLKEIVNLSQARQAGNKAEVRSGVTALYSKAQPLLARPRLLDELRPVLPTEKFAELSKIVSDYYALAIKERLEEAGPVGKSPSYSGAVAAELVNSFGQEIKRSYERVFTSRTDEFEKLIKSLSLSTEQDAKVRQIVGDMFQKTSGKPNKQQLTRAYMEVYQELDAEQRRLLTARVFEQRKLERGILAWRKKPVEPMVPAAGEAPGEDGMMMTPKDK